jgi:4'-phosphopantetheinyl transferase
MACDRLNLYVGLVDAVASAHALEACEAVLSNDERHRAERFVFERHRVQYILAHGLLRFALSEAEPEIAPSAWCFATGRHGRPFVATPATSTALHFSLSHTEGCVACIVSEHEAVGVDVEQLSPRHALMETARTAFSPEEIETLRGLEPDDFIARFFDYWTLKEAYLKARGFGLHLPLDRFSMRLDPEGIAIGFKPDVADDPRRWHFTMSSPSSAHRLAVADGSGVAGGLPITYHAPRHPWPLPKAAE